MKKKKLLLFAFVFLTSFILAKADTTTSRLAITKPSIGSSGWGVKWNSNADLIDAGVAVLNSTNAFTQPQFFADGSATSPSFAFSASTTTGLYRHASNGMVFTVNGSDQWRIATNSFIPIAGSAVMYMNDGTASLPSLAFNGDTDTGFYRSATNETAFVVGGSTTATVRTTQMRMEPGKVMVFDDGSASAPGLIFSGSAGGNDGLFKAGTNRIGFSINGSTRGIISNTNFTGVVYTASTSTINVNFSGTMETSNVTVNSTTKTYTSNSGSKVFTVSTSDGDGALVYCNYLSATVTVLGSGGRVAATTTPSSAQIGINKSANSHQINFVTGSAASGTFTSWSICFIGSTP